MTYYISSSKLMYKRSTEELFIIANNNKWIHETDEFWNDDNDVYVFADEIKYDEDNEVDKLIETITNGISKRQKKQEQEQDNEVDKLVKTITKSMNKKQTKKKKLKIFEPELESESDEEIEIDNQDEDNAFNDEFLGCF